PCLVLLFCFPVSPASALSPLSLHDALPILPFPDGRVRRARGARAGGPRRSRRGRLGGHLRLGGGQPDRSARRRAAEPPRPEHGRDRKSTRLNSSHVSISYAVFCLKKKNGLC